MTGMIDRKQKNVTSKIQGGHKAFSPILGNKTWEALCLRWWIADKCSPASAKSRDQCIEGDTGRVTHYKYKLL